MHRDDNSYRYPTYQEINPSYNRYANKVHGTSRVPSTCPPPRQEVKVRDSSKVYQQHSMNDYDDYTEYRDESMDEYNEQQPPSRRATTVQVKRGRRRSESPKKVSISTTNKTNKNRRSRSETNTYPRNRFSTFEESDDSMSYRQLEDEDVVNYQDDEYRGEVDMCESNFSKVVISHHAQKKKKVKGSSSKIQSIPEAFRKRDRGTKTTVVKVSKNNRYYDDDYEEEHVGPINCDATIDFLENGPVRFRHVCLIGGFGMIVGNVMDWNSDDINTYYSVQENTWMFTLISIYVWIIGLFIMTLEMKPFGQRLSALHRVILDFVYMLRFTWGRGILYFFSGSLQCILFTPFNLIAGGFMMVLGVTSFIMGRMASRKLKQLVREIGDKSNLSSKFDWADRDKDGYLNIHEFKLFINILGIRMKKDELIHLFMAIDIDSDRRLTYDELSYWYATARTDLRKAGIVVV